MKNLMTRKIVFGMLMMLVLAFSRQGVCDPLKLTERSDTTQVKQPTDAPFEIQFSVQLNSNATAYNDASPRRRVTDGNVLGAETTATRAPTTDFAIRIDSSGYQVATVNNTERRLLGGSPELRPLGGDGRIIVVNTPHPTYATDTRNPPRGVDPTPEAVEPYYVDSSGNVYDSNGKAVYIRTGPGTRATDDAAADPWKYTRAKSDPNVLSQNPVSLARRFDYNEEAIQVTATSGIRIGVKGSNYVVTSGTHLSEVSGILKSSMTLVCDTQMAGTYNITIEDATPEHDYPRGRGIVGQDFPHPLDVGEGTPGLRRSKIEFTLHVTTETVASANKIEAWNTGEQTGTPYLRVDTGKEIEHVSADFLVTPPDGDLEIRYKVIRGSGTLYAAQNSTEGIYRGPNQDLTVHQDANVYLNTKGTTNEVAASITGQDRQTHTATIVYEYSGSGGSTGGTTGGTTGGGTTRTPPPATPSLTFFPSTLSGAPGTTATLTAIVSNQVQGVPVTFTLSTSSGSVLSPIQTNSAGQAQTTILLPSSSATVTATASGYRQASASISVTGGTPDTTTPTTPTVSEPASIEIYDGDDQQGEINQRLDEDLVIQVLDRNNNGVSFELVRFRIVEGRGRVSPSSTRTDRDGLADVTFTPRSQGTIEIEAYLGDLSPVTFTVNVGEPPDAIKKISGDNQSGRPGARLANPFVVEVVDENDDPVSGATVAFSVTAGGGSVSPTSATTNASGRAQTVLTLGEEIGNNTVSGRVTGLTGVTFRAGAGAEVHVDASNRAPIYWIDKQSGTLHSLVDDDEVENLASNIEGVTSIAVDEANGLIYWGVQVGRSGGKIQRSRLNGRNIQTLKDGLTSIPMGIALDGAGGTIYWTSASGKIRSMATEGSTKVTKILENLANPTVLAVSNGYLYWVEPLGRVRRVNLTASRKVAANIATGLGEPLSIAIANGKIYWVERNGGKGGSLQRANLNGTSIEELKAFTGGVPLGIAIDSSDNKIYWTKLSKIQRTNLAGRSVIDVVTGLTRPSAIALGVAASPEPAAQTTRRTQTTQTTQTTPTTYSKYDVNRDGSVNNADTKAVAGAVGQSGAAITNPRTDVDGSSMVDVTDLILVIANLDDDVAAPAIGVDLTAMDLDFDRVQEQIEVLLASGDRSHAAQRALMYLQHLLASARPDATVLLANYPNPFNPETWIPYHLATSTDVKINIYNAQGILVRALTLGHQSAGYYTSRSRAAYWDGRNALGERVASGIYFYQLQADEISPLRKMVILK